MAAVASLDVVVREEEYQTDVWPVLKVVRPNWAPENIHFKELHGGLTNKLIGCRLKSDTEQSDMVLVRLYGKDTSFVDRDKEILMMRVLLHIGCGEPVYCRFTNGIAYRYNPGECLNQETVHQEHISRAVAKEMARMKASTNDWKNILREIGEDDKAERFMKTICPKEFLGVFLNKHPEATSDPEKKAKLEADPELLTRRELEKEAEEVSRLVDDLSTAVTLSHLDPAPQNFIYDKTTDRVKFIDWEYAGFFPLGYDIAAFLGGFATGYVIDESLYPAREYQLMWIRWFLEYKYEFEGKDPKQVTEKEVDELYVEVNKLALFYLFMAGVWSLAQVETSTIEFDYLGFASGLLKMYRHRKALVLGSETPART